MRSWKRLLRPIGAMASFSAALFLTLETGLPERAQFTGRISSGGLSIASEVGAIAPSFELQNLDGGKLNLLNTRGAPLIINF